LKPHENQITGKCVERKTASGAHNLKAILPKLPVDILIHEQSTSPVS